AQRLRFDRVVLLPSVVRARRRSGPVLDRTVLGGPFRAARRSGRRRLRRGRARPRAGGPLCPHGGGGLRRRRALVASPARAGRGSARRRAPGLLWRRPGGAVLRAARRLVQALRVAPHRAAGEAVFAAGARPSVPAPLRRPIGAALLDPPPVARRARPAAPPA